MKSFLYNQPIIPGSSRPKIATNSKSCNPAICLAFFKLSLSLFFSLPLSCVTTRTSSNGDCQFQPRKGAWKLSTRSLTTGSAPPSIAPSIFPAQRTIVVPRSSRWLADDADFPRRAGAAAACTHVARCCSTVVAVYNVTDEVIHHI